MSSKSTFSNSTSISYATALYELSNESSELNKVNENIKNLNKIYKDSSDFREVILSPVVNKEDKKNLMFAIAEKNNFSKILKNFLGFLSAKNRLFFLGNIIDSFLNLVSKSKGELTAKIISAKKFSNEEQQKIKNELSENFKSHLNIDYKYDPNLIAGLIIQVGSVMVDTSIKNKLKQIENTMLEK